VRKPKTKKPVTRAKAKPAKIDHAAIDAKRTKAYGDMENSVCDISRAAELAMTVFDNDRLFLFGRAPRLHGAAVQGSILRRGVSRRQLAQPTGRQRVDARQRLSRRSRRCGISGGLFVKGPDELSNVHERQLDHDV
jgi:hypothetical protein